MHLDETTPHLSGLVIEGALVFQVNTELPCLALHADELVIRGGRLEVGNATHP